jgi:hypothetical protein
MRVDPSDRTLGTRQWLNGSISLSIAVRSSYLFRVLPLAQPNEQKAQQNPPATQSQAVVPPSGNWLGSIGPGGGAADFCEAASSTSLARLPASAESATELFSIWTGWLRLFSDTPSEGAEGAIVELC